MNRSTLAALTLLVCSITMTACDDDPAGLNSGDLSDAEAAAIAEFLLSSTFDGALATLDSPFGGPQPVPFSFETQADGEVACPLGGSIAFSATILLEGDTEIEGGSISISTTQVHDACKAEQEGTGIEFTLTGKPNIVTTFEASVDPAGAMGIHGSMDGTVAWESGDRGGDCVIGLSYTGSGDETTGTATASVSGAVCGVSVSRELEVG
jgi:hypothetical protein